MPPCVQRNLPKEHHPSIQHLLSPNYVAAHCEGAGNTETKCHQSAETQVPQVGQVQFFLGFLEEVAVLQNL